VLASAAFAALAGGAAFGDEQADKARAQQLFIEGRKAIEAGDKPTGCAKMRESLKLFAVANTLFNVAQCDEGEKRIASALEHWERGLALVDAKDARAAVAKERIAELDRLVPRVRIVVPAGQALASVSLDEVELSPASLAAPLKVEPGRHVIVVRQSGREDRRHELVLAEKERTEFVATPGPPLVSTAPSSSASVGPVASGTGSVGVPPPGSGRRTAGFVVGGVGLAGLIAAGITGGLLASTDGSLDECTKAKNCTDKQGQVDKYNALVVANTVAFGVGLAGVAGGLILILTPPKAEAAKSPDAKLVPLVVPGGGGLGLSGRF